MTDITPPPEAVEAAASAYTAAIYRGNASAKEFHEAITAALTAGLKAWPGMGKFEDETGWDVHIELPLLIPLPQEASDADKRAAIADLERQGWKHDR